LVVSVRRRNLYFHRRMSRSLMCSVIWDERWLFNFLFYFGKIVDHRGFPWLNWMSKLVMFGSSLPPVFCRRSHVSLFTLFVISGVQHILRCVFAFYRLFVRSDSWSEHFTDAYYCLWWYWNFMVKEFDFWVIIDLFTYQANFCQSNYKYFKI
jgi:hypothetical protein